MRRCRFQVGVHLGLERDGEHPLGATAADLIQGEGELLASVVLSDYPERCTSSPGTMAATPWWSAYETRHVPGGGLFDGYCMARLRHRDDRGAAAAEQLDLFAS